MDEDILAANEISTPVDLFAKAKDKLTDNPNLKFKDISDETYRTYYYPNGQTVSIASPVALAVSKSSSPPTIGSPDSHRIYDVYGGAHYLPAGWIHISWSVKQGKKAFAF